jgi:hypothetical protein
VESGKTIGCSSKIVSRFENRTSCGEDNNFLLLLLLCVSPHRRRRQSPPAKSKHQNAQQQQKQKHTPWPWRLVRDDTCFCTVAQLVVVGLAKKHAIVSTRQCSHFFGRAPTWATLLSTTIFHTCINIRGNPSRQKKKESLAILWIRSFVRCGRVVDDVGEWCDSVSAWPALSSSPSPRQITLSSSCGASVRAGTPSSLSF